MAAGTDLPTGMHWGVMGASAQDARPSPDEGVLTLVLPARLDVQTVSQLWSSCEQALSQHLPRTLHVDGSGMRYCDGSGAQFLLSLQAQQEAAGGRSVMHQLSPTTQDLMARIQQLPEPTAVMQPERPPFVEGVGRATERVHRLFVDWVAFWGQVLTVLAVIMRAPRSLPWRDAGRVWDAVGPGSWPVVALVGVLFGLILGFQGSVALERFGAQVYVTNLVTISLLRELAPLMTAVVLIGRSGSAFAAELGGMQINQEVDALQTMAIDPMRYLVLPRVLAAITMMPCMTLLMIFFGLIGCAVVVQMQGYALLFYYTQLTLAFSLKNLLAGLFKTLFFGLAIGVVGCRWGLATRKGASAVGQAATGAVVNGIIAVVVIDGVFGVVYYLVGL